MLPRIAEHQLLPARRQPGVRADEVGVAPGDGELQPAAARRGAPSRGTVTPARTVTGALRSPIPGIVDGVEPRAREPPAPDARSSDPRARPASGSARASRAPPDPDDELLVDPRVARRLAAPPASGARRGCRWTAAPASASSTLPCAPTRSTVTPWSCAGSSERRRTRRSRRDSDRASACRRWRDRRWPATPAGRPGGRRGACAPGPAPRHAHLAQERDDQRRLVLAVAEAAREHLGHLVGLVAVDAELQPHVAGPADDEVVDGAHALGVGHAALDQAARRLADLVVGGELILDQVPVPGADLVPRRVGAHVQVRRCLAQPGIAGSASIFAMSRGREAVHAIVVPSTAPGARAAPAVARWRRSARHRRDQRVVPASLRDRLADELQIAEVVGHLVVAADIVDEVLDLDDVARAQSLEAHHLRAVVVVKAVPGLG